MNCIVYVACKVTVKLYYLEAKQHSTGATGANRFYEFCPVCTTSVIAHVYGFLSLLYAHAILVTTRNSNTHTHTHTHTLYKAPAALALVVHEG